MQEIQLLTSDGRHVAYVEIPHFPPDSKPSVVTWGSRVFVRGPSDSYTETFAVTSTTPTPGLRVKKPEPPPVDRTAQITTDGRSVDEVRAEQLAHGNSMHKSYIILSDEERRKGFLRPVRESYKHVGLPGPANPLRDLTAEELARYSELKYVKFETYPDGGPSVGRFWTQDRLDRINKGCGTITTMGRAIAETYARDPEFYGQTMCVGCKVHLPVGKDGEFVWAGTSERVGT